jgi:hypothetical protein
MPGTARKLHLGKYAEKRIIRFCFGSQLFASQRHGCEGLYALDHLITDQFQGGFRRESKRFLGGERGTGPNHTRHQSNNGVWLPTQRRLGGCSEARQTPLHRVNIFARPSY